MSSLLGDDLYQSPNGVQEHCTGCEHMALSEQQGMR